MANNSKYELVNTMVGAVDSSSNASTITQNADHQADVTDLLRQLIVVQTKQNELLQNIASQLDAPRRQRNRELANWKRANPHLAASCKIAADRLGVIQTEFLGQLSSELDDDDDYENLQDSEFMQSEFFEKYGPRIVHLNTLLQTLSTLGNAPDISKTVSKP